jgi:hypothetical protein
MLRPLSHRAKLDRRVARMIAFSESPVPAVVSSAFQGYWELLGTPSRSSESNCGDGTNKELNEILGQTGDGAEPIEVYLGQLSRDRILALWKFVRHQDSHA